MSPEQAAGRLDLLGPRSDVYSLGATLYCLLTGQAPFAGGDAGEVLGKVQRGDYPRPRALDRQLHPALEAVCLKAMALQPEDRYATPQALADDLEKHLADELVSAYRERLPARLARWGRHHRTPVTVAAFVLLTLIGAAVVGGLVVGREQAKTLHEQEARLEQQRKAREAQVGTLLDVAPQAVPAVLAALAPHRDEIRPLLQQAAAQAEPQEVTAEALRLWRQHRARAGLALLAEDPSQVGLLTARLQEEGLDPSEMLLVRHALRPHAAALKDDLWRRAGEGSPAGRFRALVALAAFDPGAARWEQASSGAVGEMLSANPLHLGQWVEALRPVRDHLIPPLGRVFRGEEPELSAYRQVAASVLADYAADRPDVLADLLVDGDERQYAVLFPKVQAHRDRAVARLRAELDRALAPDWKDTPLDPSWAAPGAALVRQVEAAEGLVAGRFALCQTLPLEQLDAVAEGLAKSGYRLVNLRPYSVATGGPPVAEAAAGGPPAATGRVQVAAVWMRDGQEARWAHGLTADEAGKRDADWRGKGLVPLDVAGYAVGTEPRYAVLWGPKDAGVTDAKLYVGIPADRHKTAWEPLQKGGFIPRTQAPVTIGGAARQSAVWWKPARTLETKEYGDSWTEAAYEGSLTPSNLQLDLRLTWAPEGVRNLAVASLALAPAAGLGGVPWAAQAQGREAAESGPPGLDFAAVWIDSAERVSEERHGREPAAHLGQCRDLAGRGYRPVALTAVEMGDGRLLSGSVWQLPVVPEAAKDALAKRQAQAAVALLQLGAPERVWPLLEHKPDPRVRSFLIHRLEPLKTDVQALLARLAAEREVSRRRALVLSLGSYPVAALPPEARAAWLPRLRQGYRQEPDAGLHGAVEWLLRRWGDGAEVARMEKELARGPGGPPVARQWHVNGQGQTLVVVPAGAEFRMGSPGAEDGRVAVIEPLHRVRIPRSFAIAAKEVTVEQFLHFRPVHRYQVKYSPRPDGPMIDVTWYQAAEYCNWLSEKEGIPKDEWCYLPTRSGQYDDGMRMAPGYLLKRGYRLPTEAEWEYACRAGAVTSRYYGEADELLGEYAWYGKTTGDAGVQPGGLRKPNDLGLFDLYGNVAEWVQDPGFRYRWPGHNKPKDDIEYNYYIRDNLSRLLRGGAFDDHAPNVRSANRNTNRPSNDTNGAGFRVASTSRRTASPRGRNPEAVSSSEACRGAKSRLSSGVGPLTSGAGRRKCWPGGSGRPHGSKAPPGVFFPPGLNRALVSGDPPGQMAWVPPPCHAFDLPAWLLADAAHAPACGVGRRCDPAGRGQPELPITRSEQEKLQ
jgi:formylglycine-generating enzyme required for sulfatase activity